MLASEAFGTMQLGALLPEIPGNPRTTLMWYGAAHSTWHKKENGRPAENASLFIRHDQCWLEPCCLPRAALILTDREAVRGGLSGAGIHMLSPITVSKRSRASP